MIWRIPVKCEVYEIQAHEHSFHDPVGCPIRASYPKLGLTLPLLYQCEGENCKAAQGRPGNSRETKLSLAGN